ncbi:MAG: DNA double-strand break repair nuclease NurA [Dehalococcoidia bacterium]|nr:DNA double-strand break repair nuclease NurA [Dehalococcoidia bacterium]
MSLDLSRTLSQLQAMASRMRGARDDRAARVRTSLDALRSAQPATIIDRAEKAERRFAFLAAEPFEQPSAHHPAPPRPPDYCALAVDGSHIDVDRHLPARCALINLGGCALIYGGHPSARLWSSPHLYATEEELALRDPDSPTREEPLQGALLGLVRAVEEVRALADAAQQAPASLPTVALVDGTLLLLELSSGSPGGGGFPPFVRRQLLQGGLLPALDALRALAQLRPLAVASYISMPNATEVAGALRLALCPFPVADCSANCGDKRPGQRPCDAVHGLNDRALFGELLAPGERSALFRSRSSIAREYGEHQVCFFYVNVGPELARVEMPEWVARNTRLLDLVHAAVLDQCRRGGGYPPVLQEAHEQAVISGADREEFRLLVHEALEGEHLPAYTSEKERSKRLRAV